MDFEKLCMVFSMQEPYYGILLSSMNKVETRKIPTIAVGKTGNVFVLAYNPDFLENKTTDEILILLKHETMHLAFNHFMLFDDLDTTETTHAIANMAADMEVNNYIDFSNVVGLNPLLPSKYGLAKELGGREYFKQLFNLNQQMQQKANANAPSMPCNGGHGGKSQQDQQHNQSDNTSSSGSNSNDETDDMDNGSIQNNQNQQQDGSNRTQPEDESLSDDLKNAPSFDDHSMWPDKDDISKEQLQEIIEDMLVFAADEVEKSCGKVPGELKGKIELLRNKKRPRPVADWKRYFRRYLGNEFSELIRKSKKRESRRFPDAAGNRHRRKSHILVAIDTSGSVSMPEYREFFGQIRTLTRDADFHVVECDAMIQHEYDFKGHANEMLHGGGGTSFSPVIDMYLRDKRKYDALVYFTDGEAEIPNDTPKDTLWVISSKGLQERERYRVNGASVVFIPKKQTE